MNTTTAVAAPVAVTFEGKSYSVLWNGAVIAEVAAHSRRHGEGTMTIRRVHSARIIAACQQLAAAQQ